MVSGSIPHASNATIARWVHGVQHRDPVAATLPLVDLTFVGTFELRFGHVSVEKISM